MKTRKIQDAYSENRFNLSEIKFILIAPSFGEAVALNGIDQFTDKKIILLSPLVSFVNHNQHGNEQNLFQLGQFIKPGFGNAYRFDSENQEKMCKGEIFEPDITKIQKKADQIILIYDEQDETISKENLLGFCKKASIQKIFQLSKKGHLSYTKWNEELF